MNTDFAMVAPSRGWLLVVGLFLFLVGFLAVGAPFMTSVGAVMVLGALIVAGGLGELFGAFRAKGWGAILGEILLAAVHMIAGLLLFFFPGGGVITLTLLVGSYLVVAGAIRTSLAFQWKPRAGWGWILTSGIVTALLGVMVVAEWPGSSAWVLGTMLGISWMMSGASMVMLSWSLRNVDESSLAHA
jgi:uncharacterized membrane protein HdeD (DUF308 family)